MTVLFIYCGKTGFHFGSKLLTLFSCFVFVHHLAKKVLKLEIGDNGINMFNIRLNTYFSIISELNFIANTDWQSQWKKRFHLVSYHSYWIKFEGKKKEGEKINKIEYQSTTKVDVKEEWNAKRRRQVRVFKWLI